MKAAPLWCDQLHESGFAVRSGVLDSQQVKDLISSLESIEEDSLHRRGGIRNLLDVSDAVRELSSSPSIRPLVTTVLGEEAFPVRGILFDKTEAANWKVPWHQDLTIAVAEKVETNGFGPWSVKTGVQHVQPPAFVLENMLSVRIHLDNCPAENGALKVIPGSHRAGRLSENESARIGSRGPAVVCAARAGDAVLMRPLIVHASSASERPRHRRVIHLDYAAVSLPGKLRWLSEIGTS
jgi:hypothetical protein